MHIVVRVAVPAPLTGIPVKVAVPEADGRGLLPTVAAVTLGNLYGVGIGSGGRQRMTVSTPWFVVSRIGVSVCIRRPVALDTAEAVYGHVCPVFKSTVCFPVPVVLTLAVLVKTGAPVCLRKNVTRTEPPRQEKQ